MLNNVFSGAKEFRTRDVTHVIHYGRIAEFIIWFFVAILLFTPTVFEWYGHPYLQDLPIITSIHSLSLIAGALVMLFPILFWQIFDELPLGLLRRKVRGEVRRQEMWLPAGRESDVRTDDTRVYTTPEVDFTDSLDPRQLLALYSERSSALAKQIYGRAGVYLMVGVLIAFVGLAFFYTRAVPLPEKSDPVEHALALLPGFGVLFFIEFVALFFLRQYRAAMDEFRHFDAIRRNREESLVILKMFGEYHEIIPTKDVLQVMNVYSNPQRLGKGETSERLEARRLETDEVVIFEKFIDAMSALKESRKNSERKKRE